MFYCHKCLANVCLIDWGCISPVQGKHHPLHPLVEGASVSSVDSFHLVEVTVEPLIVHGLVVFQCHHVHQDEQLGEDLLEKVAKLASCIDNNQLWQTIWDKESCKGLLGQDLCQ